MNIDQGGKMENKEPSKNRFLSGLTGTLGGLLNTLNKKKEEKIIPNNEGSEIQEEIFELEDQINNIKGQIAALRTEEYKARESFDQKSASELKTEFPDKVLLLNSILLSDNRLNSEQVMSTEMIEARNFMNNKVVERRSSTELISMLAGYERTRVELQTKLDLTQNVLNSKQARLTAIEQLVASDIPENSGMVSGNYNDEVSNSN
jgi:hypothetical protein